MGSAIGLGYGTFCVVAGRRVSGESPVATIRLVSRISLFASCFKSVEVWCLSLCLSSAHKSRLDI